MNKEEYVAGLEKFGLPKKEYIILSGGSLLLRGLRETSADYDLCMSEKLAQEIKLNDAPINEKGLHCPFENVEVSGDFNEIKFDVVDGYQCESLESILEYKRQWRRPKDLVDIKRIEEALKKQ